VYVRNSYGPASGGTVGARPLFGLRLLLSLICLYVSAVALLRPTSCRVFLGFLLTGLRYTPPAPSRRPRGGALPPITKPTVLKALHPKLNYATIITGYSNHRPTGGTTAAACTPSTLHQRPSLPPSTASSLYLHSNSNHPPESESRT
jgi:hypothetical protein